MAPSPVLETATPGASTASQTASHAVSAQPHTNTVDGRANTNNQFQTGKASSRSRRIRKPYDRKVHNRIKAVMAHVPWYGFKSQARLAADLGFSRSAVSRLLREECSPSLALAYAITDTLEQRLGRKLDPRELFSLDGRYPTASACELAGCRNCIPAEAFDSNDTIKPKYKDIKPGEWSLSPQSEPHPLPTRLLPDTKPLSQKVAPENDGG